MDSSPHILIRNAEKKDAPAIFELIQLLAEFERAPHEVTNTVEDLFNDAFGQDPVCWTKIAEYDGEIVGMSLFYIRYSTWKGKTLYLEDIIVKESYRGKGIGTKLFEETIIEAKRRGLKAMNWQVLDWNTPAIDFYKAYDCILDNEWINCKLTEQQIQSFEPK